MCKAPVTQSRFRPRITTIHPDLSQMLKSGYIGMRRGGKKENPASIRCLAMLLRCLRHSSTDPLRLMTAALRFTTVELRMLTMPPRFDRYDSTTSHESARFSGCHATVPGEGGTLIFSSYVGSGPASTVHPLPPPPKKKKQKKKNRNSKNPQKYLKT